MERDFNQCFTQPNGTVVCPVTDFDPHNAWHSGSNAAFDAETGYPGSDVAGFLGNDTEANFKNVIEQDQANWASESWIAAGPPCPYYHTSVVMSYTHFQTYTDPPGHGAEC